MAIGNIPGHVSGPYFGKNRIPNITDRRAKIDIFYSGFQFP